MAETGTQRSSGAARVVATPTTEASLAEAAMALLGCRTEEEVYAVIGEFMRVLCPDTVVVVNETSPDLDWLITRHLFGLDDSVLMKAATMVGFNPIGKRSAIAPIHREKLITGKLAKIPGGYVELASFEVPWVIAQLSAETFRLRDAFSIGIANGSNALGNIQIYTRAADVVVPTSLVETFAHHCYSTLVSIGSVRKLAESARRIESLLDRDRLLQLFFDRNPDGVVVVDPVSGQPVHFNDTAHRQLGYTREEFSRLSMSDIESGSAQEDPRPHIELAMQSGLADFETTHCTKSGEIRNVRVSARRIDATDQAVCLSIWRDITDQKSAERASRQQAQRVDLLLDSTVEGILGVDLESRVTFCNAASLEMLGYASEDEVLGKVSHALYHYKHADGTDYDAGDCPVGRALSSGDSVHIDDEVFWRADGTSFPVEYWARPLRSDGEMVGSVLSFVDVTERRRAHDEIADALGFTQAVLSTSPIGIAVFDAMGRVVLANDAATRILGTGSDSLPTKEFCSLEQWGHSGLPEAAKAALVQDKQTHLEFVGRTTYGEAMNLSAHVAPIERANGRHVLITFNDLTEIRTAERVVVRANQRLEGVLRGVIETLGNVVEARDPYTKGHEQGVARIAKQIAEEMGLTEDEVDGVEVAALVHDVGKLGVPTEILTKPGRLSDAEFELIRWHSQGGYDILKGIDFDWPIADVVIQHHERMDGSGYPNGLSGEEILMAARILAVADVLEAMAADRPYRPALGLDVAMDEITSHPQQYDPEVVSACVRLRHAGEIRV